MNQLIVIASVTDGLSAEIGTFMDNAKAVLFVREQIDSGFTTKPYPNTPVEDYIGEYQEWVREENDNMCDTTISYEIVEL